MPETNALKIYAPNTFYHIYNRGVNKQDVFLEPSDHLLFVYLFERYLSRRLFYNSTGRPYEKFDKDIKLYAYCTMSNHFHMLIETGDNPKKLSKFMLSHQTAFVRIYNNKHNRVGHLFQSRYKAVILDDDMHKERILNYIHMNPGPAYAKYPYSSYQFYLSPKSKPDWLNILGQSS